MAAETVYDLADYEGLAVLRVRASTGRPASTKLPQGSLVGRVRVQLTGHHRPNPVTDLVMITVQCWDETTAKASRAARDCFTALSSMHGDMPTGETVHPAVYVRSVKTIGAIVNRPDPDAGGAERYQFTVEINARPTREVAT